LHIGIVRRVFFTLLEFLKKLQIFTFLLGNNLYGHSQSQLLPTDQFRWLSEEEIQDIDFADVNTDGTYGMICEVDLHYPAYLHRRHNSFILAPEKLTITHKDLSPYSQGKLSSDSHISQSSIFTAPEAVFLNISFKFHVLPPLSDREFLNYSKRFLSPKLTLSACGTSYPFHTHSAHF